MRIAPRPLALLTLVLGAACAGDDPGGILLDVSSEVEPLDRLTLTVLGETGAIVLDREVPEGGGAPDLPGLVRLDVGERREDLRVLGWGWQDDARVAFGMAELSVAPDIDVTEPLRLEEPPVDGDGDGVPDGIDVCPDVSDPDQGDTDADGAGDACGCEENLIANGDFEEGITGWTGSGATESWENGGHGGARAIRVCKDPTGGPALSVLTDEPSSVLDPSVGEGYALEAWARADADDLPQNLRPRLRERDAQEDQLMVHQNEGIELTTDWQRLSLEATVTSADIGDLEVYFSSIDAADDTCFVMDDICLRRVE